MSVQPYLGMNANVASAEEMRQRGILNEDESLLALFDGVLLDERRRRIGGVSLSDFIALTDRRLVTWARGFFNDTVDSFEWAEVDVIKAETWDPWHGRVIFGFRLAPAAPRTRRIMVKGTAGEGADNDRVLLNTLDYMPADDVTPLANMIAWIGDQVVAGVSGTTLIAAFREQFPAPERPTFSPFFSAPPEPPPPPPPPVQVEQPRRRWWQRKAAEQEVANSGNLIADYENRRSAQPAGDGTPAAMITTSQIPLLSEQPNMYEVSRSLRLMLEVPRKLAHGVRRAGEMMSGAGELMSGMQDPRIRRNAMQGLYMAAAQQEAENGPLASVSPVVRAAVRFAEPLPSEEAERQAQTQVQSRRVQVRASVRRSPPAQREMPARPEVPAQANAETPPEPAPSGPVRRSISVRRVEAQPQPQTEIEAEIEAPTPTVGRIPVRRININGDDKDAAAQRQAVPAGVDDDS